MPPPRSLRILMVAPTSFFSDYGGHIRILEETLALQALGHQVAIVTYYKGRDLAGLDIRRTPPLPYRSDYEVGSSRHKLAFDIFLAGQGLREARRFRPDVIHGHMHEGALLGWALARLLRVPLVFDFQGSLTGEMVDHGFLRAGSVTHRAVRRMERFVCHRPAATLTSSLRARSVLVEQFGVPPETVVPLPDCVDVTRFDPARIPPAQVAEVKRSLGIPVDRPVVAYLGFLAPYQGTDQLIAAAARLKRQGANVHFLVMGFPNVDRYQALAAQLDVADRVRFTGKIQYDYAPLYLAVGDITVSPKLSATEGSGKVLNYMALGKPVVASDNPVHREYLAEYGVYAPLRDEAALAEAIGALLADPQRCERLGAALRRRAESEYSWERAARRIALLYYSLGAGARRAP